MMKEVQWIWDYGVYVPFCPYCGEPAYEKDRCVFCGKPYKWVEGEHKPTVVEHGEYTIVQATNNHVTVYKGGVMLSHSSCAKKLTEAELIAMAEEEERCLERFEERRRLQRRKNDGQRPAEAAHPEV